MRLQASVLFSLLAATPPVAAQVPAADNGWHLGGGVEAVRFGHVAVSEPAPGIIAELRPSSRSAVHAFAERTLGRWGVAVEAGWAGGHLQAGNDALSIEDRTASVSRYRAAVGLGREVARLGLGTIVLAMGPTLDVWNVSGNARTRAGLEGRLAVRVPLGAVVLENRIGVGFSSNPITADDIGEPAEFRALRAVFVGMGLRVRI
jgi:hypothetical protein